MGKLQEVYDECKRLYDESFGMVKGMAKATEMILTAKGESYNPDVVTIKFELLMQYSLLQVAVADNDFDRNELIFIRDITNQGDLVDYLNVSFEQSLKWEDYYQSDPKDLKELLNMLKPQMLELGEEFVTMFAFCDSVVEEDCAAELEQNVLSILLGLSAMDSNITEDELNTGVLMMTVIKAIQKLKEDNA